MIVISDRSSITSLISIGYIDILRKMYKEVLIPNAVNIELKKEHVDLPGFIKLEYVKDKKTIELLLNEIDIGEAESIVLAKEKKADLLLIDDHFGRIVAEREGVKIIGLLGVLLIAKNERYIDSIKKIILLLEEKAGFWISE